MPVSTAPIRAAIALLMYVAACMLILMFSAPDYAAEADEKARAAHTGEKSFQVADFDDEWTDTARSRAIPVHIRVALGAGPFPVILFSHGLGGSRTGGAEWGRHWASHGYCVIHLQHPGSDEALWRDKPKAARLVAIRAGYTREQLIERVADVRFSIDELARRHAGAPLNRCDLTRIGMSGHSFGASTTQAVAGQRMGDTSQGLADTRIAAAIAFSPSARLDGVSADDAFGAIRIPFFSITGTLDEPPLPSLGVGFESRRIPFMHMAPGDKYLLVIDGADHMLFNGTAGLRDFAIRARRAESAAIEPRAIELVKSATLAFWNVTLKNDRSAHAWLTGQGFAAQLAKADSFERR